MHSTSRRMLRPHLFAQLHSWISFEENHIRWFLERNSSCIFLLFTSETEMFCNYMPVTSVCTNLSSSSSVKDIQYFKYYQTEFGGCEPHTQPDVWGERCLSKVKNNVHILGLTSFVRIIFKTLDNSATLGACAARAPELFIFLRVHFDSYTPAKPQGFDSLFFYATRFMLWQHQVESMSGMFLGGCSAGTYLNFCHILSTS